MCKNSSATFIVKAYPEKKNALFLSVYFIEHSQKKTQIDKKPNFKNFFIIISEN